MTAQLSRERLEEIRYCNWMDDLGLSMAELNEMARMLLAGMDSEPVYQVLSGDAWVDVSYGAMCSQKRVGSTVRTVYTAAPAPVMPGELHQDTQKLVADFCAALAEKLYKAQLKYGYDADWKQDGWPSQCQAHFHQHIAKGDPRDVAAYCAFMWYHGWKTEAAKSAPVAVPDEMYWQDAPVEGSTRAAAYATGWNACRAAMLKAVPVTEATVPLDYVQGEYDGREWAAQLAEANHPQTGDWLYDDPFELAKAIRKGPDVPHMAAPVPAAKMPEGWKLVPVDPTEAMLDAAYNHPASTEDRMRKQYASLLAAAPAAPEQEV